MRSPGAPLAVGAPIAKTAASTSGMRDRPLREGERLIEFVIDGVFIFWRLVLGFTDVLRDLGAKFSKIFRKSEDLSWGEGCQIENGKCARASCLSGESPDFSTNESLMTYQGFGAGGLAVPSDFPSAAMQCFSIRVAEFELDMLTVCLDGFAADAEFLRDLSNTVFGC